MEEVILVKVGEIVLKGLNRRNFEIQLVRNIKKKIEHLGKFTVCISQSTIYIKTTKNADIDAVMEELSKVFGIANFSKAAVCEKDLKDIQEKVCEYLEKMGHKIIARNYKTKLCEIDIVSILGDKIYFTEVKYSKSNYRGGGLLAITDKKKKQMECAAKSFLKFKKQYSNYSPLLAVAEVSGEEFRVDEWFPLMV